MPYIGRAATNTGNVRYLDDIASGFDGSDTTFTAQVGGVSITPDQESVKIFLDGVFQHPGSGNAYTISGSTITFTAAPVANTVFSAYVVGAGAYLDDNAVSSAKLDDDAVTAAKLDDDGTGFQVGDLGVGGSLTSGDKLTVTGRLRASGGIIGDLTGNVTGNASGTALTVTQAAQTAITSVGTLSGLTIAGTGTNAAPTLAIDNSSSSSYIHSIEALGANMSAGQINIINLGKIGSTKNSAVIGYKWNSDGADTNLLTFEHWGTGPLMSINGAGNVGIGTASPNANLVIENSDGVQLALQDSSDPGWGFKKDRVSSSENLYFGTMTKAGTFSSKHTFHEGGAVTFAGDVIMADSKELKLGNNADLLLYHNGSNSYLDHYNTGELYIRNRRTSGDILIATRASNGDNVPCVTFNSAGNSIFSGTTTADGNVTGQMESGSDRGYARLSVGNGWSMVELGEVSGAFWGIGPHAPGSYGLTSNCQFSYYNGSSWSAGLVQIATDGKVGIGIAPSTYALKVDNVGNSGIFAGGVMSAASFDDRTPYPETLDIAQNVLKSHKKLSDYDANNQEKQLDHSKLHKYVKTEHGRNLSAVVSCLVEVVNNLTAKVEALENG